MAIEHRGRNVVLYALLASLISGCSGAPQYLRDQQRNKEVWIIKNNYQAVYRELLHRARDYHQSHFALSMRLSEEIWTDTKEASLALIGDVYFPPTGTWWVMDFKAIDEAQTQVTLYLGDTYYGKPVHRWFSELGAERADLK
jgi:hypothetical protein